MSETGAYLLYSIIVVGAIGLFCLMPRQDDTRNVVGVIVGAIGVAALLCLLAVDVIAPDGHPLYFCLFSAIALLGAARVITHTNPVYSAVYFVLVVVAVAALLVLLDAEFAAVALIIVYAGAIMVTYMFMIMLAQQAGAPLYDRKAREPVLAIAAGFLIMAAVAGQAGKQDVVGAGGDGADGGVRLVMQDVSDEAVDVMGAEPSRGLKAAARGGVEPVEYPSNSKGVGVVLSTQYIVALEVAGLLLLIAMVGAIAFSTRKVRPVEPAAPQRPLGEIGKEVRPF